MKLSIIVPVYNMAADGKLAYCLDSLVAQTLPEEQYEILPVDDASTDRSARVLREYGESYPGLIRPIYSQVNRRQGGARNLGLQAAKGDFVGFMDADDWAAPDMFEKLLAKAAATGADVVGCQYHITKEHSREIGKPVQVHDPAFTGPMTEEMKKHFIMLPGSMVVKIYRRSVIEENRLTFPEGMFYEDNMAAPIWMSNFAHFELVDEPLYAYYQHEASTVHTVDMDRLHDRMKAAKGFADYFSGKHLADEYYDAICSAFTRLYYVNTLFSYMQTSDRTDLHFLRELREGMRSYFPDFESAPDYRDSYDEEQRRLLHLHMRSPLLFTAYYRALQAYRKARYGA